MDTKQLDEAGSTFAVIFSTGEDPVAGLTRFAEQRAIGASSFTAIGAFREAELGYFDWDKKDYERIPVREQVEVLSLIGDIAFEGDQPKVHAHVVLGRRDGSACGGHLLSARVRPTLEVILEATPAHLQRIHDSASGLALIKPRARDETGRRVLLTQADFANLSLLAAPQAALRRILDGASIVASDAMPPETVTMNTQVVLRDETSGDKSVVRVVFPSDADSGAGMISVLEPLGSALLGAARGQVLECRLADGVRRLRVEQVIYQPEDSLSRHLVVNR